MKITLFIGSLSGGGAERVVCNLANYLSGKGHTVQILTMSETATVEQLRDCIEQISLLQNAERKNFIKDNILRAGRLYRYLRAEQVDVYIPFLSVTTAFLISMRWAAKAKIIASQRVDPASQSPKIQKLLKYAGPRADAWVFQTESASKWFKDNLQVTNGCIIPNAINPVFIRSEYTGLRQKRIAAAGRLTDQKNFALLIRSFARISEKYPDHKLLIYGQGELKESLVDLVDSLNLTGKVEFPGYIKNMQEELEKAQMFVLSSDYEGMPNALMEAMALGLPCVSTDCGGGGARFLIEDGVNGLLVPVKDEIAMAEAMETILSDPEKAATMGKNARKIQETLAPEKIYGQWESFIREISERV